jgi:hypothetical protein
MDIHWKMEQEETAIYCPENCSLQTCDLKPRFLISENILPIITSSVEALSSGT